MTPRPLGYIEPKDRTKAQHKAHERALAAMPKFAIPDAAEPKAPVKVVLTDWWKRSEVVADIGMEFPGYRQLTGACVGVSAGNAIATLGFIQRTLSENPTKAFIPWWPFNYGRTRSNEGDRGQGEGAVDSVMGQTLVKEGVFACTEPGLPQFSTGNGLYLTSQLELQWSDGASSLVTKWKDLAKVHLLGTMAPVSTMQEIRLGIINGYPNLNGHGVYCGHGAIKGSGENAYVSGKYDGNGGHSTCFLGYWDHPNDGPLFLYSNQWDTATYPKDPAGGGRCCVWLTEAEAAKHLRGGQGESMMLSHLNWFPAQPSIVSWIP